MEKIANIAFCVIKKMESKEIVHLGLGKMIEE